jgi:hypothetical protein
MEILKSTLIVVLLLLTATVCQADDVVVMTPPPFDPNNIPSPTPTLVEDGGLVRRPPVPAPRMRASTMRRTMRMKRRRRPGNDSQ